MILYIILCFTLFLCTISTLTYFKVKNMKPGEIKSPQSDRDILNHCNKLISGISKRSNQEGKRQYRKRVREAAISIGRSLYELDILEGNYKNN